MPAWFPVVATVIVPGSGYVLLSRPMRGLLMLCWMFIFGYITLRLSSNSVSLIGRFSGGIAVWAISVLEIYRITHKKTRG